MPNRLNILYIEDDPADVTIFGHALRGTDPNFRVASNGSEAVQYLEGSGEYANRSQNRFPDLIFLDWRLPVMDGKEFMEWFRKTPYFDTVPVVVLVGSGSKKELDEARTLGAALALPKPPSALTLRACLTEILSTVAKPASRRSP
jgi:CheY-like chemotaxis protein